ncbi:MAG TPA: hypothetical protein VFE17_07990 [Candidatus Baltobacteraceae bacterium]|jgi:hypothetical protein|nr:hypothetical protein [Candidatus Baltobacteraceae bacterium]
MNDELYEKTKERVQNALRETQDQTKDAAEQLGGLLRFGAEKLKKAADNASQAIRDDINRRP